MRDYFIGLMSGTSSDGVDAALVEFTPSPRLHTSHFLPYPPALRTQLLGFAGGHYQGDAVDELGRLDTELGEVFAAAALALMSAAGITLSDVRAIGSHGQTVRHRPDGPHPFTLQIADPNIIAARSGIATVADFRRRDVAVGGQGAPLVPAFHRAVFADRQEARAVVNIGGIANMTVLPAKEGAVSGFDTGPGNLLMDLWSREHLHMPHDMNGKFAASGVVDETLLHALLSDEYFHRPAPKSTGRERFNKAWLAERLASRQLASADVMATLSELTARSISDAVMRQAQGTKRVLLCGGGVHNAHLRNRLIIHLPDCQVVSTDDFGIAPDWVEAMAFAWLARETLAGRPGNLPAVTGANRPAVLGAVYHA
ncbi:MAG TPA: anhydro-N-acetylmuramic acid kinase [Gammaproteobacteria bacterium]|nr:anhydro-N-acetylmuramic acid kinase [Gammaproteobacteria bacterium]